MKRFFRLRATRRNAAAHTGLYASNPHTAPPADRDRPVEKRMRAAVGNLGVYAVCLGVVPDTKDRAAVVALMKATFPSLLGEEIGRVVGLEAVPA